MIQVSRRGIKYSDSAESLDSVKAAFVSQNWIRFPGFLDPEFCEIIQRDLDNSEFQDRQKSFYTEVTPRNSAAPFAMLMMLNNTALFRVIEKITGCDNLTCFMGRIYRHLPGTGHHLDWHSDWDGRRRLALSVNLSNEAFQGGVLALRENKTGRILAELPNTGLGDAILFRISQDLEHSVTDVEGPAVRTTLAGWFESGRDFRTLLADSIAHSLEKNN